MRQSPYRGKATLGGLDDRLRRAPEGWRHRLALIEAAELSWFVGDRVAPYRLALWIALRLSGVQEDNTALARVGWAVRRLSGGPGPEAGLAEFVGRHSPETADETAESFSNRAGAWREIMDAARDLHPVSRACMGYHLWSLAGLGQNGDRLEAAVTAGRIAAGAGKGSGKGAVFAPLAMSGAGGRRAGRAAGSLARRDGAGDGDCDAPARRNRGLGRAGRQRHGLVVRAHPVGAACGPDRLAPGLGADGRSPDRRQPRRRAAQPDLDGSARADPRGHRAGPVQDVAGGELMGRGA